MASKISSVNTRLLTRVGALGAISAVLFLIEVPVIPPIYKLDFSTVPVMVGGFAMGVWPGIAILFIKNVFGLLKSTSMGVGELADFLMGAALMVPAVMIYRHRRTFTGAVIGMLAGCASMVIVSALTNYFILIPFYIQVMGLSEQAILGMVSGGLTELGRRFGLSLSPVDSLGALIARATIPFNVLKGVALSLVTTALYKRLSPLLKDLQRHK